MATWEDASRCPICKEAGREDVTKSLGRKGKVITLICENRACRWYNTGWVVQVGPNGEIPDPTTGRDREFAPKSGFVESMANRAMEELAMDDPSLIDKLPISDERKAALRIEAARRR